MRICMITEGAYPYVVGGVSSWIHSMIQTFPQYEFILVSVVADREMRGKFVYTLPKNLVEVHEVYVNDIDWGQKRGLTNVISNGLSHVKKKKKLAAEQYEALRQLLLGEEISWEVMFDFMQENISLNELLMGEDFFHAVLELYEKFYPQLNFSDFLWNMRSIYLPLFHVMRMPMPQADLYHCVATGYSGVLGAMGKIKYGSAMLISEHGIYTREREEELIKAKWVKGVYKDIWIAQFRKLALLGYQTSDQVTCLFSHAKQLQMELGCPEEKILITPNGIDWKRFQNVAKKLPEEEEFIYIGAVLRVTPIKDIKTMIQAFGMAKQKDARLKLWIMGGWEEDEAYAKECFQMVERLTIPDVVFTGRVNVVDYLGKMDMTVLTSISEGQPLTILESFAVKVPVVATNVGNCRGLIEGEIDDYGAAGIVTHIMNQEEIAEAFLYLASHAEERRQMGESGYQRLMHGYRVEDMQRTYHDIYQNFSE